jgi:hypothetical protein
MLDSNVSHALVDDDSLKVGLRRAADRGSIGLLVTHIQVDENLDHPDQEQGRRLIHAMMGTGVRAVPTYGLVLNVSRPESATLFDEATATMFEAFLQGNPKHSQDGLLAATALHENAILVTAENEKHRRRLRRHFRGLEVWALGDLRAFLEDLEARTPIGEDAIAAGALLTPAFTGPGSVKGSVWISSGGLVEPYLTVSLASPKAGAGPQNASTVLMSQIERAPGGGMRFSVTVRRTSPGEEPPRVFRWELAPGQATQKT